MSVVSYYVHHHGAGHRGRFEAIRAVSCDHLVAVSQLDIGGGCRLAPDTDGTDGRRSQDPTAGGALHWAPLGSGAASARLAAFAGHLHRLRPDGAVIDVSVEAALVHRLAGVPTIIVRQHGRRDDAPHVMAYRTATRLLAPWPAALEDPDVAPWVRAKTTHVGFVAPPTRAAPTQTTGSVDVGPDDAVILWGRGGGRLPARVVRAIAQAVRPGRVHCVGDEVIAGNTTGSDDSVVVHGWIDDVDPMLDRRPLVVASAGNNAVARAARAGCPLVVVPQARPFDEQERHARLLGDAGVAAVAWRSGEGVAWDQLITSAFERAPALRVLGADGATTAARLIHECFS